MIYKHLKEQTVRHWQIGIVIWSLVLLSGCASFGLGSRILTSKEQVFVIPKGAKFTAVIDKKNTELIADADLIALYTGSYAELQEAANKQSMKKALLTKKNAGIWAGFGGLGALLGKLAQMIGKKKKGKK